MTTVHQAAERYIDTRAQLRAVRESDRETQRLAVLACADAFGDLCSAVEDANRADATKAPTGGAR